jgi:hypothetical protein
MAINRHAPSSLNSPCRYPAPLPVMAAGHLWPGRLAPHPSISPPSLPSFLFKTSSSSRSPLCTRSTPTHALDAPPSHSAAAPSSPPPGKLVAGEGLPLLSLSPSLVFLPAFTKSTMLQVRTLDALRSCAPITPQSQQLHELTGEADPPLPASAAVDACASPLTP